MNLNPSLPKLSPLTNMDEKKFRELMERVEKLKASGGFDLSREEDLALAVMNLISLEEHFFFTGEKTGKEEYLEMLAQVRQMRKELMAKMIPEYEGETWCAAKHLLAAAMRIMEVGTKCQSEGQDKETKEMFDRAYKIFNLFWAVRLKLINLKGIKKIDKPMSTDDLMAKLVDCCKE